MNRKPGHDRAGLRRRVGTDAPRFAEKGARFSYGARFYVDATSYVWNNSSMTAAAKRSAGPSRRGRPKSNPLPRREQLRLAKRAERARLRASGVTQYPVKLARNAAERLKAGMKTPGFAARLHAFLEETVIPVRDYPNLAAMMWNRTNVFVTDVEAFRLYERNWRFVDTRTMPPRERALIARLTEKHGKGVLNV